MSSQIEVQAGEIRARGLGRMFKIRLSQSRSLKETILRRELPRTRELWALKDVDFDIARGQTFGIVGRNGSGKSTLLKLIAGIFSPSTGQLRVAGRVGSLIEIGAGFHPEFTGVENVYLNAAIYGLKRSYVDEHLDEIIEFAELRAVQGRACSDLLLGHVHAAGVRRRDARPAGHPPPGRGARRRR